MAACPVKVETIGRATLYQGDAYEMAHSLGRFDVLCTDPPYVIKLSGGGKFRSTRPHFNAVMEQELDVGFQHSIINPLLYSSVFVFCHNDQVAKLMTYLEGNYFRVAICFWEKTNPMPVANRSYRPDIEIYLHAWQEGYHPTGDLADKGHVVRNRGGRMADWGHPTVKPDIVMDKLITNANGRRVLDPFMGTGSTGIAALRAGREFVGIEKNEKHFETALRRFEKEVAATV